MKAERTAVLPGDPSHSIMPSLFVTNYEFDRAIFMLGHVQKQPAGSKNRLEAKNLSGCLYYLSIPARR